MALFQKEQIFSANLPPVEMNAEDYESKKQDYESALQSAAHYTARTGNIQGLVYNIKNPAPDAVLFMSAVSAIGMATGTVAGVVTASIGSLFTSAASSPMPLIYTLMGIGAAAPSTLMVAGSMASDQLNKIRGRSKFEEIYYELRQTNYTLENKKDFGLLYEVIKPHLTALSINGLHEIVDDFVENAVIKPRRLEQLDEIIEDILKSKSNFKLNEPILNNLFKAVLEKAEQTNSDSDQVRVNFANAILRYTDFKSCKNYIDGILAPVDLKKDDLLHRLFKDVPHDQNVNRYLISHHFKRKSDMPEGITNVPDSYLTTLPINKPFTAATITTPLSIVRSNSVTEPTIEPTQMPTLKPT